MIKRVVYKPVFNFLIVALSLTCHLSYAQYSKRFDFSAESIGNEPQGSLISIGAAMYGMTPYGGVNNNGVIFKIEPDGVDYSFTILHSFNDTLKEGSVPLGSLVYDGAYLYGMTSEGGMTDFGTIFKIKPDGTDFDTLLSFLPLVHGGAPQGSLVVIDSFLYGMTSTGAGTVFRIKKDGTQYLKLLVFNDASTGGKPFGSLVYDNTFLYGMNYRGGVYNYGTIFKIKPDSTGYQKLLDFNGAQNGARPRGDLVFDSTYTFLYGMTFEGGSNDLGTVFKIKPDATGYQKLHDFEGGQDGRKPHGSLIYTNGFLFGMTRWGGANVLGGIVFKVKPDSTVYTKLLNFTFSEGGLTPLGSLIMNNGTLFGMTSAGGIYGDGTVFKMDTNSVNMHSKIVDFTAYGKGSAPAGSLVAHGANIFGMTSGGGEYGKGTVFGINIDGSGHSKKFDFNGIDGSAPSGSLVSDGVFMYGMTSGGGANNTGIIFKITANGNITKMYDFEPAPPDGENGRNPQGSLIFDNTFLYGMTWKGGVNDLGTVFKIQRTGNTYNYTTLFEFSGVSDGRNPLGSLVFSDTLLYGMASAGGSFDDGVIFEMNPQTFEFEKLHDFFSLESGSNPTGSLVAVDSFLYGMTQYGGASNNGVIFKIKKDGTFVKLYEFPDGENGRYPHGSLVFNGTYFHGMTESGGAYNNGVLFKMKSDGTYYKLKDLDGGNSGRAPLGDLVPVGGQYYGMTSAGGKYDAGTIFIIDSAILGLPEKNLVNPDYRVLPNPCNGVFRILSESPSGNMQIEIFNVLGERIYAAMENGRSINVDISNRASGVYFVSITTEEATSIQKIIINR